VNRQKHSIGNSFGTYFTYKAKSPPLKNGRYYLALATESLPDVAHNAAIAGMADRVVRVSSGAIAEIRRNDQRISPSPSAW
jgi:hypothetical protein